MRPGRLWALTVLAVLGTAAPAVAAPLGRVVVRRTEHGIPHIQAQTWEGLGYGYGHAFASDAICTIAEDYVTVDAQRSRWFGPGGSYEQRGNGTHTRNIDSDFFWQGQIDAGTVPRLLARRGRFAVPSVLRSLIRGYVEGYNRYLHEVGGSRGVPDPTCRGKGWVHRISERTADRRLYQLALLASGDVAIPGIAGANPPAVATRRRASASASAPALTRALRVSRAARIAGSNAIAVGSAGTRDRRHGLLLGNPHFPWVGPERFYQAHLTIPGKIDVTGASLYGVPLVLIGHTRSLAWSHTVSTAFRFTPYELKLAPGTPTSYVVDSKTIPMTRRLVRVRTRNPGGRLGTASRTLYGTRWGPVFTQLQGQALPWSTTTAFAFADANRDNLRLFSHFLATDRAQSVAEELRILRRYQGLPWVNTIAADRTGHALYADIGTVPHVTNAEAKRCNTALGATLFSALGLPVLDGSRSSCAWGSDPDAAIPGILGPRNMPSLQRRDYVTNSNDSYWLPNPAHPLEGYPRIIGDERTQRSLRTRIGLLATRDVVRRGGFTGARMQRLVLSDRQLQGELNRDNYVNLCRSFPNGLAPRSQGVAPVAVGDACDVLARWDRHENLRSRGAILFRRVVYHSESSAAFWAHPFSAADPLNTPNGLNTADPITRTAIGDGIADLRGAGIPLDAAPGEVQKRAGIPIHGGPGDPNGDLNAIDAPFVPGRGFGPVEDGSSFIQVVTWGRGSCPDARTILTYSLSPNPRSPFFADQTRLFSRKRWLTDHFCAGDVRRHTRRTEVLSPR